MWMLQLPTTCSFLWTDPPCLMQSIPCAGSILGKTKRELPPYYCAPSMGASGLMEPESLWPHLL